MNNRPLDLALAVIPTLALLQQNKPDKVIDSGPEFEGVATDLSQYDIDWENLAGQRPVNQYHIHTLIVPTINDVLNLFNGHHSKRSRDQIRAKILNRVTRGGSPFGSQRILAQKIEITGYNAIYSDAQVSNLNIGKKGNRKSHGYRGKLSLSHSMLSYMIASNANQVLSFYDRRLNDFYSRLASFKVIAYENSVAKFLCYDRSASFDDIKDFIFNFDFEKYEK